MSHSRLQEDVSPTAHHRTLDVNSQWELEEREEEGGGETEVNIEAHGGLDETKDSPRNAGLLDQYEQEEPQELMEEVRHEEEEVIEERDSADSTDDDSLPELFQPSSPLHISKNFILPDIMEESENDQSESQRSSLLSCDGTFQRNKHKVSQFDPFEEAGLDVIETNFDDDDVPLPYFDDQEDCHNVSGSPQDPPILPVSPPPGPLLSPRVSMMLLENEQTSEHNRLSVLSTSSEMAPPLPTSLPPGNLIPRESMYHDSETKVDLWYELMKRNAKEVPAEIIVPGDPTLKDTSQENEHGIIFSAKDGVIESSLQLTTAENITSDSGFPDTDLGTTHSDNSVGRGIGYPLHSSNHPPSVSNKNSSTSATSYSDERTTEYSGSVGLKTNASSNSQVSMLLRQHNVCIGN